MSDVSPWRKVGHRRFNRSWVPQDTCPPGSLCRYEAHASGSLHLYPYRIVRETPKGKWVSMGYGSEDKFVLNDARKRFAHEDPAQALRACLARKRSFVGHAEKALLAAQQQLATVERNIKLLDAYEKEQHDGCP